MIFANADRFEYIFPLLMDKNIMKSEHIFGRVFIAVWSVRFNFTSVPAWHNLAIHRFYPSSVLNSRDNKCLLGNDSQFNSSDVTWWDDWTFAMTSQAQVILEKERPGNEGDRTIDHKIDNCASFILHTFHSFYMTHYKIPYMILLLLQALQDC